MGGRMFPELLNAVLRMLALSAGLAQVLASIWFAMQVRSPPSFAELAIGLSYVRYQI